MACHRGHDHASESVCHLGGSGSLGLYASLVVALPLRGLAAVLKPGENDRNGRSRAHRPRRTDLQEHGGVIGESSGCLIDLHGSSPWRDDGMMSDGTASIHTHLLGRTPWHVSQFTDSSLYRDFLPR
jgi:hypothetical protein